MKSMMLALALCVTAFPACAQNAAPAPAPAPAPQSPAPVAAPATTPAQPAGWQACSVEKSLPSRSSDTPLALTFVNSTTAERDLYWLNFDSVRVLYSKLQPGQSLLQSTFVTHPWVITDAGGSCLGIYVAAPGVSQIQIDK